MSVTWDLRPMPAEAARNADVSRLPDEDLADAWLDICQESASKGASVEGFDLGREWAIVHYLLTGNYERHDHALSRAIFGRYVADDHIFYLAPEDVAEVAEALSALAREEIEARFDISTMRAAGLYHSRVLSQWWLEACVDVIEDLRDCYRKLARGGMGGCIVLG